MTYNEKEALKEYATKAKIGLDSNAENGIYAVKFTGILGDVVTTDFRYAFQMLQRYRFGARSVDVVQLPWGDLANAEVLGARN